MSCHTIPDTMISLATRFYSLAITLPHGTACRYCLEHTCQIKEQLMHLIFNYCLVLQTPRECQSEQSCLGEMKTEIYFCKGVKKIGIKYVSATIVPYSAVLQFSYKTCSSQPWIIYLFFFLHPEKVSSWRVVGKGTGVRLVFVYLHDWCGQVWSTLSSSCTLFSP